jgi:type II secretory pathway pseudopilin PulG
MVALLVGMAVMAIVMTAALPVWRTVAQREREAEFIFRGNQYARAIAMFQRKYGGAFPPSLDVLVTEHFLRKKYKDPITGGDFVLVGPGAPMPGQVPGAGAAQFGSAGPGAAPGQPSGYTTATPAIGSTRAGGPGLSQAASGLGGAPAGGIMGVTSKSTAKSFALFNGRDKYNEWIFVGTQASTRAGTGAGAGTQVPGGARGTNQPGGPPRGGTGRGGTGSDGGFGGAAGPSRGGGRIQIPARGRE